ncbi:MAG: dihydropteroate synthase [Candidatus Nanopelagicales bacterium]
MVAVLPTSQSGSGMPVVWGVLNVTPDSFSDGGRFTSIDEAVAHARSMCAQGADVIDVGGESTRPGAERVTAEQEKIRVLPVIKRLAAEGFVVSIDTMRAEVAAAAVSAGAQMVNDVSGGRADPQMHSVVAGLGVPYVIMHWRGHSDRMNELAVYSDPVRQVCDEITEEVAAAQAAGIGRDRLIIDPGIGFAKEAEHNWALLRALDSVNELGLPVLVGASRKRFLGALLADADGRPRESDGRDVATAVLNGLLAWKVWGLRVHDVQATLDALKIVRAMSDVRGT